MGLKDFLNNSKNWEEYFMLSKNKDGVELRGLGECTLDDVFNDPNGLGCVKEDAEYYYVFPNYKPGYCGDSLWMINKKNHLVSITDMRDLFFCDVIDRLKDISFDNFKRKVS